MIINLSNTDKVSTPIEINMDYLYTTGLSLNDYVYSDENKVISSKSITDNCCLIQSIDCDLNYEKYYYGKYRVDIHPDSRESVIDLSGDGDRWEGNSHLNKPFGLGVMYDKYGNIRFSGVIDFYGTKYQSQYISYKGSFFEGKRHGYGVAYSGDNTVLYEGIWCNDGINQRTLHIDDSDSLSLIHNNLSQIVVADNCSCEGVTSLKMEQFFRVKTIEIGNNCFSHIANFRLFDLPFLQSISIGNHSFHYQVLASKALFTIQSCPNLKSIHIGNYSLLSYNSVTFEGRI